MDGYELTDRGKIAIAVVIAVILIALAAILMVKALAARPQQPDEQGPTASGTSPPAIVETTPPEITDSPPPTGGGLVPTETPPVTSTVTPPVTSTVTPTGEPPETSPEPSPDISQVTPPDTSPSIPPANPGTQPPEPAPEPPRSSVDALAGTLSLYFSVDDRNSFDAEATSMIGTFLRSSKNTRDSYIVVEIPKLTDENKERLVAAVVSAFASQGVSEQRIAFSTNPSETTAGALELNIYYYAQQGK